MIPGLPIEPFYYLATPYSKYPGGIDLAFRHAACIAGNLVKHGYRVYSPIAHTHPLALHAGIDPLDHKIWLPFDETMMKACEAILVAKMLGWETSFGVQHEISVFRDADKRVFALEIDNLMQVSGGA